MMQVDITGAMPNDLGGAVYATGASDGFTRDNVEYRMVGWMGATLAGDCGCNGPKSDDARHCAKEATSRYYPGGR